MTHTASHRALPRLIYGLYAWGSLLVAALACALLLACVPGRDRRRRLAQHAARGFFFLIGSPIRIEGELATLRGPCVVIANHASYLDGIILTAALPARFTYLIKHEMKGVPLAGFILRRLGSSFVNRGDQRHRKRTARELLELAMRGDPLAFFPEGTFDAEPGLRPFQPGAFGAALRAGLPVVPIVIHGSRHKLRAGAVLPSPGGLRVRICPPLEAARYGSARELMRDARAAMLDHLGEPDLDAAAELGPELPRLAESGS